MQPSSIRSGCTFFVPIRALGKNPICGSFQGAFNKCVLHIHLQEL